MKAIHTKYLPATNTRGSRIKAYSGFEFSVTIPYAYELSELGAHYAAVKALVEKHGLDWDVSVMCYGGSADGRGYTFCFPQSTIGEVTK